MINKMNFKLIENKIREGIKDSIKSILEKNIEERVYSYEVVLTFENLYISATANTKEYLESNIETEDERMYYKFCEQEWKEYNITNIFFEEAKRYINIIMENSNELFYDSKNSRYTKDYYDFVEYILRICIKELRELSESEEFIRIREQDGFINVMIPEYLDKKESINIFASLNEGKIVEEYTENIDEFL